MDVQHKVLIVDGDPLVAETLAIILRKRGFDCRVTHSGGEALASSEEFCPELLVCDIWFGDLNGLEVISAIAKKCPDCRILLFIGRYSNLAAAHEWVRNHRGSARLLIKPLPPAMLLQEVDVLVRARPSIEPSPH